MDEHIESICRRCFHSYVCEQFNEHRDDSNQECHFANGHFVPAADVYAEEDVRNAYTDGYSTGMEQGMKKVAVRRKMRVEITTDDFRDIERARADGCYREHYFCPVCGTEIGHKTFDRKRQFGQGTVLHSNKFPSCCPDCGTRLDGA